MDFAKKDAEALETNSKSKSGLILTTEKENSITILRKHFEGFIDYKVRTFTKTVREGHIGISVFMLTIPESEYRSGRTGISQYSRRIFPIGKIIENSNYPNYKINTLVLLPAYIAEYGETPEWYMWDKNKNSSDERVQRSLEPDKFGGGIDSWINEFAIFNSPLEYFNSGNISSNFIIPQSYILSELSAEKILEYIIEGEKELNEAE